MLYITCPTTKKEVPTGMSMDAETFKNATIEGNAFQCPACGQMHTWGKSKAHFEKGQQG